MLDGVSVLNPVFQDRRPRSPHFFFFGKSGGSPASPNTQATVKDDRLAGPQVLRHDGTCALFSVRLQEVHFFFELSEFQTTKNRGLKKQHRDPNKTTKSSDR